MVEKIKLNIKNKIAIITLYNPPLNALNQNLRKNILEKISYCQDKENVKIIFIKGNGKNFSVGADINEFNREFLSPSLSEVCNRIENSKKPVVAILQGYILGGGLELALSAHLRISFRNSFFGFPEVKIGLLPGAGGTQRLPRLIGIKNSLEMIIKGNLINEDIAYDYGLIEKNILNSESDFLNLMKPSVYKKFNFNITSEKKDLILNNKKNNDIIDFYKNNYEKRICNKKIINSIKKTITHDFEKGIKYERKAFLDLKNSEDSKALIHVFLSERRTKKIPEISSKSSSLYLFKKIGLIGSGKMGNGIAISCLKAGKKVFLIEKDKKKLLQGKKNIFLILENDLQKKRITKEQFKLYTNSLIISNNIECLVCVDIIIEAIFEDLNQKKLLFRKLDEKLPKRIFFGTNTSYLSVEELAYSTSRPEKFIGLHFFSPANKMKLIEIIITQKVSNKLVHSCFNFAKNLNKIPVRSSDHKGFIGNSILSCYSKLIFYLVEDGMSPYKIDKILKKFGYPIGFHQMIDLAGGEISWSNRKRNKKNISDKERYTEIPDILCELGRFGQKSGKGYYKYLNDKNIAIEDDELLKLIEEHRKNKKIDIKTFSEKEFLKRYIAAIVNQASNLLLNKVALRPSDIDIVSIYGYGFPKIYGGPMTYADNYGLSNILEDIKSFYKEDPYFWKPSSFLIDLVKMEKCFKNFN